MNSQLWFSWMEKSLKHGITMSHWLTLEEQQGIALSLLDQSLDKF